MDLTNKLANHLISVIFTKFWVQKMFLTYIAHSPLYKLYAYVDIYIRMDEWATMKQACRDELVVYLFFPPQYVLRSTFMY